MASPQFKLFKRFTINIDEKQSVLLTYLISIIRICMVLAVLYGFFISIGLMGAGFKILGKDFAKTLIETTNNPFVGLFIGILATALIQSSSTTTSMVVAFVASGTITVHNAIPVVMGANIGTAVTSTIVAMGHATRKLEFERAFAAGTVHDMFNLMTVAIFLPLEIMTGVLSNLAHKLSFYLAGSSGVEFKSPLKLITKPVVKAITNGLSSFSDTKLIGAILVVVVGIVLLFISLYFFTKLLKLFVLTKFQSVLEAALFKSGYLAMLVGLVFTAGVQSSSITTSLMIPMAAAGIIGIRQVFPVALGANVGTTVTALLASLAAGSPEGLTIALVHLFFNLFGILTFYPIPEIREIPIKAAIFLAKKSSQNRIYALLFVFVLFFVIPGLAIFLT
jgi:solute carrier family 34 (sodium-dependent phosphate cotransporter)